MSLLHVELMLGVFCILPIVYDIIVETLLHISKTYWIFPIGFIKAK